MGMFGVRKPGVMGGVRLIHFTFSDPQTLFRSCFCDWIPPTREYCQPRTVPLHRPTPPQQASGSGRRTPGSDPSQAPALPSPPAHRGPDPCSRPLGGSQPPTPKSGICHWDRCHPRAGGGRRPRETLGMDEAKGMSVWPRPGMDLRVSSIQSLQRVSDAGQPRFAGVQQSECTQPGLHEPGV